MVLHGIRFWDTAQALHILFQDMVNRATAARQKRRKLLLSLLREIRLTAGFTQVQLADSLGVPQSFISKYESGERRLDLLELQLVCRALGIPLVTLVQRFEDGVKAIR